jgi:hypothetical protein
MRPWHDIYKRWNLEAPALGYAFLLSWKIHGYMALTPPQKIVLVYSKEMRNQSEGIISWLPWCFARFCMLGFPPHRQDVTHLMKDASWTRLYKDVRRRSLFFCSWLITLKKFFYCAVLNYFLNCSADIYCLEMLRRICYCSILLSCICVTTKSSDVFKLI